MDGDTSTFDALSLVYSCASYLATQLRTFTLFDTHYFELIILVKISSAIYNVHLNAVKHEEEIIFLHIFKEGCSPANKNYGLHVA